MRQSGCRLIGFLPGERVRTEEPDEGNLQVRVCGEGAGQPVPLPGSWLLGLRPTSHLSQPNRAVKG